MCTQVRLLVGVLKAVGTGDLIVSDGIYVYSCKCMKLNFVANLSMLFASSIFHSVERILEAKDVAAASPMAPACGLYLGHVKYDLPSDL